jgi:cellulose synthase/poly-beta-1,6-N-acetylglucosamine synthase-like glycosyltransferase
VLLALAVLVLVGQLLSAWAVRFNHRSTPDIGEDDPGAGERDRPPATVLVVVPARNERANIGPCVEALRASEGIALRIRVVDDGSSDGTGDIARAIADKDARISVIEAGPLPDGWMGKNHALARGVEDAGEDFLLFVDADLRVGPDCLRRAVALAERRGADLLCLVPRMETRGFWELAAQTLMAQLIYVWLPARDINDPSKQAAAGTGPFMLFRRAAYERIGGHAAVRGEVIEDLRLAEATKRAGLRLVLARGVERASLRMYDSLGALVAGWSKNMHVALGGALWAAPLVAIALILFYGGPWLLPVAAAAAGAERAALVATAGAVVALAARLDLADRYGVSARHPYLAPVGAAVMAFILLRSAWRAARRRPVEWKGRSIG